MDGELVKWYLFYAVEQEGRRFFLMPGQVRNVTAYPELHREVDARQRAAFWAHEAVQSTGRWVPESDLGKAYQTALSELIYWGAHEKQLRVFNENGEHIT